MYTVGVRETQNGNPGLYSMVWVGVFSGDSHVLKVGLSPGLQARKVAPCSQLDLDCEEVLRWAGDCIATVSASPAQRRLLDTAFAGLESTVREIKARTGFVPMIDLAPAVHAAISREHAAAVPLAAACAFVFLGLDLFDDLADGDRQRQWEGHSAAEMNLAAATVLTCLPTLIIAGLDVSAARRARMAERLACGLLRMSAGQQADLALTGAREVRPSDVEAAVVGKSGEQFATYCALAAEMAGASEDVVGLYADFGRELGTAGQFASDCHELLVDPECRDLAHGSRTLPLATHMERLPPDERSVFLDLLDSARSDAAARDMVRRRLRETAEVRRIMFGVHIRLQRARRLLDRAGAGEPGRSRLLAAIAAFS